ncbi:MAG: glycosyltransferase family 2 protein [Verrucomicrobiota bacterium]
MPEKKKIAVVIPSYKAADTLPDVIDTLPEELSDVGKAIIVHDCSPDRTGEVADDLARRHDHVEVVHHEQNRGYGGALKSGLQRGYELECDIFPVVHSDGQYAPHMALELCEPIAEGKAEIVQGSRMKGGGAREGGMPLSRYLPNKILTAMENLTFGTKMAEFHSGYMVFSRNLLESVPYQDLQNNYNFDAEMIIMAHLCGYECLEIPIPTRYDDETSSLSPIPYGLNVLRMMWRYTTGHYLGLLDNHTAKNSA